MYNQKLCFGLDPAFGPSPEEQVRMFCDAGFDAFFCGWKPGIDLAPLAALAKELGMIFQSVHAPFNKTDDLWADDEALARKGVDELKACLAHCAEIGVPIMVSHCFIGFDSDLVPNETGLARYGEVIDEAERLGVKIAFENTEGEEFLAAIMERFAGRDCVGYCWDSGHEMCYNGGKDLLALYGDRLFCTHINDNLGVRDFNGRITYLDDLHLLPFDGIGDWDYNAARLDKCGYSGIMTFELNVTSKPGRHENDIYAAMGAEKYFAEVYKRACRFAAKRKIAYGEEK